MIILAAYIAGGIDEQKKLFVLSLFNKLLSTIDIYNDNDQQDFVKLLHEISQFSHPILGSENEIKEYDIKEIDKIENSIDEALTILINYKNQLHYINFCTSVVKLLTTQTGREFITPQSMQQLSSLSLVRKDIDDTLDFILNNKYLSYVTNEELNKIDFGLRKKPVKILFLAKNQCYLNNLNSISQETHKSIIQFTKAFKDLDLEIKQIIISRLEKGAKETGSYCDGNDNYIFYEDKDFEKSLLPYQLAGKI